MKIMVDTEGKLMYYQSILIIPNKYEINAASPKGEIVGWGVQKGG